MIKDLKQQKVKLEEQIEIWEKFNTSNNTYFNVLLPKEVPFLEEVKIPPITKNTLEKVRKDLTYYKYVLDIYNNNDFIINQKTNKDDYFYESEMIYDIYCRQELIDRLQKICDYLENEITKFEKTHHV